MKKKIYLIGLNLYSIILALKIRKDFKNIDINILEASGNFLNAYSSVKIKGYKCNPGFHALEDIRSKNLISLFSKILKLKKNKKTRGILIGKNLISYTDQYSKWPLTLKKNFKLFEKKINIKPNQIKKKIDNKYLTYLKNNIIDDRISVSKNISLLYPWFFSPNYKINYYDEGFVFNQKIRDKRLKHSFVFPKNGLFESISVALKKLLKKKNITVNLKTPISFEKKNKNEILFHGNSELNEKESIKILCIPVVPLTRCIKNFKKKLPKLEPIKYFTGLMEIKNLKKNILDKFSEIIVSSEEAPGLRRISLFSEITGLKKKIYQYEFSEHNSIKDVKKQVIKINQLMSKFIILQSNNNKKLKFVNIGYAFIRNFFSPNQNDIKKISDETVEFFKNEKNFLFPRQITWPINSNKHMIYANEDYNNVIKKNLK